MPVTSSATLSTKSSVHALWGFVASWLAYSTTPEKQQALASTLGVHSFTFRQRASVIDTPLVVMEGETTTVVGFGGTDNFYLWLSYLQLYGQVTHNDLNGRIFEPFIIGANSALARLPNDMFAGRKNIIFAGHSFGGAIAEVAAKIMTRRGTIGGIKVVTFGKPKCGDAEYAGWQTVSQDNYSCHGDPIPSLPPDTFTLFDPAGTIGTLVSFRPSGPVTYLTPGGAQLDGPVDNTANLIGFLGRAIASPGNIGSSVPHPMGEYLARITPLLRYVSADAHAALVALVNAGFFS